MDGKTVGKPAAFEGEESQFPEFTKKLEDYLITIEPRLEHALEWALEQESEITLVMVEEKCGEDGETDDQIGGIKELNQQLKTVPSHLTEMEAFSIVQNCGKNALEAWRRLNRRYGPVTGGRRRNHLRAIMAPQRVKMEEHGVALQTWEDMVARYKKKNARLHQPELPDDIKCSALEALVLEELERHLQMNVARLSFMNFMTFMNMKREKRRMGRKAKINEKMNRNGENEEENEGIDGKMKTESRPKAHLLL